ncbi:SMI1/KNR4 family protein [Aquimarina sp. 2201CG14-23]|uniref:SMI1/KNR4 family protein n=1 Tax=Aquimarina mycalae TaxID=3040073 RepID=UPI002477DA07|nr:SMI1/KNR4 family protein [Aquimarina sp. 2201CG14-23]MDH7444950.1 SMI1/KNR4 family protein [Aquimarina sp. 2201CG14-23]
MIDIKSKSEIIIPFENIGDENWSDEAEHIITELADNWGDELPNPISTEIIAELEKRLGATIPDNLKLFYKKFGISNIGEQLQNLDEIDWIKNIWKDNPEYGPDFSYEDKKHLPFLISFSDYLGNGNMFCFHSETKEIYYYDHDTQPYLIKLFDNVSDYIKGCLISCQADLFNKEIGQEQVEEWCNEILNEMFGKHIVEKWKF